MIRLTLSLIAFAVSFTAQANVVPSVDLFFQGTNIVSAREGSEVTYVLADDILVPKGLRADIYSGKQFSGEKQTLVNGELPRFSFQSFIVGKEFSKSHFSVRVEKECVNLAYEGILTTGNVNLFPEGETSVPELIDQDKKYKLFCPEDGPINLMQIAKNTLGVDAYGKGVLLTVFSKDRVSQKRFNFYLHGKLPKLEGATGEFITSHGGYKGNNRNYHRVIKIDKKNGHLTIRHHYSPMI